MDLQHFVFLLLKGDLNIFWHKTDWTTCLRASQVFENYDFFFIYFNTPEWKLYNHFAYTYTKLYFSQGFWEV